MYQAAVLSGDRRYRYALWRCWQAQQPCVLFVALNPSTADESTDDPTLMRCMHYARAWGYGGVCMANLFAFRATSPALLKSVQDPVGPDNDRWLVKVGEATSLHVAAWGNFGTYRQRAQTVRRLLPDWHCLKLNRTGEPAHPLYLQADLQPEPLPLD